MQGTQYIIPHADTNAESVWFKIKLISQYVVISLLISQPFSSSYLYAAPIGGDIVGGTGSISSSNLTTTINQASQNLSVDWKSFNVNTNERVHFIQPNASSVALNRILGNNGSTIQGQIDANGQVILVNPYGVFFSPTASVNVGGIIASTLDISPADFMNGHYIFNEVIGVDGAVINSGTINASLGGNVALIGKQVKNEGLITANLGSVILAAGKQSVLTFDNQGLIGVSVTKEVLQSELGLEAAVVNNGKIKAEGGRVLLTASTSQDVFSQAVNLNNLEQATGVVVNEDGSYTLGNGADVVNTGSIDVSSKFNNSNTARIILVGENVTSSGSIKADTITGTAGEVELHANNKALLTQSSNTSSQSLSYGFGGVVKVLGDKVGIFDQSIINVSGFNGGGQAYIGGGFQGSNPFLKNSSVTLISSDTRIYSDAILTGNGGKTIVWSNGSTIFSGLISGNGGLLYGDGGFTEVSGKSYLGFYGNVIQNSFYGNNGQLLLDPKDLTIVAGSTLPGGKSFPDDFNQFSDDPSDISTIGAQEVARALQSNDLTISANNDILIQASINEAAANNSSGSLDKHFTLRAGRSIKISNGVSIELDDKDFDALINDSGVAGSSTNRDTDELAVFTMGTGASITTRGGNIDINSGNRDVGSSGLSDDLGSFTLDQLSTVKSGSDGGYIYINNLTGNITLNGTLTSDGGSESPTNDGNDAGTIGIYAGNNITINDVISASGSDGAASGGANADGGRAGAITIFSGTSASTQITLNANISALGGAKVNGGNRGRGASINLNSPKLIIGGNHTISADGLNPTSSTIGDINLYYDGAGDLYSVSPYIVSNLFLNGNLTVKAGDNADINLRHDIDYDGLTSDGTLLIEAGDRINIHKISDSDTGTADLLNVSLKANNDNGTTAGVLTLYDSITTGNGSYLATATTYDGRSYTDGTGYHKVKVDTGTAGATITSLYRSRLGEMAVGGNLLVTATSTGQIGGLITQEDTTDILDVTGSATFNVKGSSSNDYINLINDNLLRGEINLATNTDSAADVVDANIFLTNAFSTTTLNNVTAFGNLTVNAKANLTVLGLVQAFSNDGSGTVVTRNMNLNFGINDVAGTVDSVFTSTGATFSGNASGSDLVNLNIVGSNGHNVFTLNDSTAPSGSPIVTNFTNLNNVVLTGNTGNDTFDVENVDSWNSIDFTNINTFTLNGSAGLDVFNAENINFTNVANINFNGGNDKDVFNIKTDIVGTSTGVLNGNGGNDEFNILATALTISSINGGGGTDKLTAANELNVWDIPTTANTGAIYSNVSKAAVTRRVSFASIENLTGNANVDQFDLAADITNSINGLAGADIFNIGTTVTGVINGGADNDTLNAENVNNYWDITTTNTGSIFTDSGMGTQRATFTGIETLNGNAAVDEFNLGADVENQINGLAGNDVYNILTNISGAMDGGANDDTFNISSDFTGLLTAGSGNDTFSIAVTGLTLAQQLNGGAGTDELIAANELNVWDITANDEGDIYPNTLKNTPRLSFTSVETLTGNANVDQFDLAFDISNEINGFGGNDIFNINSMISGAMNGGAGIDTFNIDSDFTGSANGEAGDDIFDINTNITTTGVLRGGADLDTFNINATDLNIALIDGGSEVDTIFAANEDNYWVIDSPATGRIYAADPGNDPIFFPTGQRVNFSGVETLTGSSSDDIYIYATDPSASLTTVNGGAATSTDIVRLADNLSGVTLVAGSLTNIERYVGNLNPNTLQGASGGTNTWRIEDFGIASNGVNDGKVNDIEFVNFSTLLGGTSNSIDNFTFFGSASIANINGSGGNDTINGHEGISNQWNITDSNTGTLNAITSFVGIENLIGSNLNNDTFTFSTSNSAISGLVDGGESTGDNDIVDLSFSGLTNNIILGPTVGYSNIEEFRGNGGNSSISGENFDSMWTFTNTNTGQVSYSTDGGTTTTVSKFTNFAKLNGGTAVDTFVLTSDVTSQINGNDGNDIFDIRTNISGVIDGGDGDDTFNINQTGLSIASINGGSTGESTSGGDTIRAANEDNFWAITSVNGKDGYIYGLEADRTAADTSTARVSYAGIEDITGGSLIDDFQYSATSSFGGSVDGGDGIDTLDLSALTTDYTLIIGTSNGNVSNVERFRGNNDGSAMSPQSTLILDSSIDNVIDITNVGVGSDGVNDGVVNPGVVGAELTFIDFNNISGGDLKDEFTIKSDGSITGLIDGGASVTDTLDIETLNVNVELGNTRNNNVNVNNIETITAAVSPSNKIISDSFIAINNWAITGAQSGTINGTSVTFSNFTILQGGISIDKLQLNDTINFSGIFDGGSGLAIDEVIGGNVFNYWDVTNVGDGTIYADVGRVVTRLSFDDIETLSGNGNVDRFDLAFDITNQINGLGGNDIFNIGTTITGAIDGGAGTGDVITAANGSNFWDITTENDGTVYTASNRLTQRFSFTDIEILNGNAGVDEFNLIANVTNQINGLGGNDIFNIGTTITGAIYGGAGIGDVITASNTDNYWNITSLDTGTVYTDSSQTIQRFSFYLVENINGGSSDDYFYISLAGSISDKINGGSQNLLDTINISEKANQIIDLNNVDTVTALYNGIEKFVGDDSTTNIIARTGDNDWLISGINDGSVTNSGTTYFFDDFYALNGSSGDDTFTFEINSSFNGIIDGGGQNTIDINNVGDFINFVTLDNAVHITLDSANDNTRTNITGIERILGNGHADSSLKGSPLALTNWTITGDDRGNVTSSTAGNSNGKLDFIDFANLIGNDKKDDFIFEAGTSLSGLIDGGLNGAAESDTVNMSSLAIVDVTIGQDIVRVESITGNNDDSVANRSNPSTLRSGDLSTETRWTITGVNEGTVDYDFDSGSGLQAERLTFVGFNNIRGGENNDDSFEVIVTNGIQGTITGGDGAAAIDSIRYSTGADITVGDGFGGILEIEGIIGDNQNSTLKGIVTDNPTDAPLYAWIISEGTNTGQVTIIGGQTLTFVGFNNIIGGSNVDTFDISGNSSITGSIRGGAGNDIVTLSLTGNETGGFTFIGDAGSNDTVTFAAGVTNYDAAYTSNIENSGNDEFVFSNATNNYSVKYDIATTEFINNNLTINNLTINGTAVDDTITLADASFKVNNSSQVNFTDTNSSNLIIDGLAGDNDSLNITSSIGANDMDITFANTAVTASTNTVTARNLILNNVSAGISNVQRLLTDIASLSILNSKAVYLNDVSADLDIAQLNTADIVDIRLEAGNITNSSALVSSADFLVNAVNGNITLTGNNQLSGPVTLLAANDVTFNNSVNTILGDVTANNFILNVSNASNTTQEVGGVITAITLLIDSEGDFDLSNDNVLNNITVSSSNNVTIKNVNSSNIINVNAVANVDLTSNGITLGTVTANSILLDAGNNSIADTNTNATNLKANNISLFATNGIGTLTNAIEIEVDGATVPGELSAVNKNSGDIALVNTGNVLLRNVSNLDNDGNIDIVNNGNLSIDTVETITDFTDEGMGRIDFTVSNGDITGSDKNNYLNQSDVRAHSVALILDGFHSVGSGDRPLSVEVPDTVQVLGAGQTFIYFFGTEPITFEGENEFSNQIFDLINNLAGQQLIEVESLAQIDPAIFTDVRNYSHSDNALMMPVDQRYDDTDEEKQKNNQIN